jgi:acid phosphatase
LIADYGLATDYFGATHPSQPNYLALFAGSTMGVTDNGAYHLAGRNLADQLRDHDRSWHLYAQSYPGNCSQAATAYGGVDLDGQPGTYARKHNPAISFTDISSRPSRCRHITDLAGFDPAAADFEMIVPNMSNDMHDGTTAQGDDFLAAFVPRITESPEFAGSLLLITWDEGNTDRRGGGHVATLVISPLVQAGFRSTIRHNHYSLLRTIQRAFGLGCLRHTCEANDLREFFS